MNSGYPPRGGYGGSQPVQAGDAWQGLSQLMQQAQMMDITNAKPHLLDVQSNSGNKPTSPWCLTPRLNTLSFSDGEHLSRACSVRRCGGAILCPCSSLPSVLFLRHSLGTLHAFFPPFFSSFVPPPHPTSPHSLSPQVAPRAPGWSSRACFPTWPARTWGPPTRTTPPSA